MKIEVLGTGCAKCKQMEQDVIKALADLGMEAEVAKVQDIQQIMAYKVMSTPALVVDGKVKTTGRLPRRQELYDILKRG